MYLIEIMWRTINNSFEENNNLFLLFVWYSWSISAYQLFFSMQCNDCNCIRLL